MFKFQIKARIALWLICVLFASPVVAQQKRAEPAKKLPPPQVVDLPPTLDTLLSDEAYRIYFEVRNVGQVARSTAVTEMVGPLKQLIGSFDEVETMLKWTTEHADQLAGTRLFFAAAPTRKTLPEALVAVEFSSVEEAKKFQRQLRAFLPTVLPTPTPTPSPAIADDRSRPVPTPPPAPPRPTHEVMQEGSLVIVAARAVPLRDLKPRGAKLLVEDSNFNVIRSRFASEPLFLYVNVASFLKEEREQREKWQEMERKQNEKAAAEAAAMPSPEAPTASADVIFTPADDQEIAGSRESPTVSPDATPTPQPTLQGAAAESVRQPTISELTAPLMSVLFTSVQPKWPDALGAALVLDDDAYTLRLLTINSDDSKAVGCSVHAADQFRSGNHTGRRGYLSDRYASVLNAVARLSRAIQQHD